MRAPDARAHALAPEKRAGEPRRAEGREALSPERVCPNCGSSLFEQRCKLLCPNRQCGHSMSCSDFY